MSDTESETRRALWHLLIRRAYGIPDVIGDEGATAHVAFMLTKAVVGDDRPEQPTPIPARFLDAFVRAAEAGELDGCLIELPRFSRARIESQLAQQAGCQEDQAKVMLDNVLDHVRTHLALLAT